MFENSYRCESNLLSLIKLCNMHYFVNDGYSKVKCDAFSISESKYGVSREKVLTSDIS